MTISSGENVCFWSLTKSEPFNIFFFVTVSMWLIMLFYTKNQWHGRALPTLYQLAIKHPTKHVTPKAMSLLRHIFIHYFCNNSSPTFWQDIILLCGNVTIPAFWAFWWWMWESPTYSQFLNLIYPYTLVRRDAAMRSIRKGGKRLFIAL